MCPQCKYTHYEKKIYCARCRRDAILRRRGMPTLARQQVAAAAASTYARADAPAPRSPVSDSALLNASISDASGFDADADAATETDFEVGDEAVRERPYIFSDCKYSLYCFSCSVLSSRMCFHTHVQPNVQSDSSPSWSAFLHSGFASLVDRVWSLSSLTGSSSSSASACMHAAHATVDAYATGHQNERWSDVDGKLYTHKPLRFALFGSAANSRALDFESIGWDFELWQNAFLPHLLALPDGPQHRQVRSACRLPPFCFLPRNRARPTWTS